MPSSRSDNVRRNVWTLFHPVALAIYPALFLFLTNSDLVSIDALLRASIVMASAALLLILALRAIIPDLTTRAVLTSIAVLNVTARNFVGVLLQVPVFGPLICAYPSLLPNLAALALAGLVLRFRGRLPTEVTVALNLVAALLLSINLITLAAIAWQFRGGPRPEAASIVADVTATPLGSSDQRDIYYIVVDSYARADTLNTLYGGLAEDDRLREFLSANGFYVAQDARSNYAWTLMSLASSLNLNYLDELAAPMEGSLDRSPLRQLIRDGAALQLLKAAGYRTIVLASDYSVTTRSPHADDVLCGTGRMTEYETGLIGITPFARLTDRLHRNNVRCQLRQLATLPASDGPQFVFAHIVAPHPPFVFDADGCAVHQSRSLRYAAGACAQPDYAEAFRHQSAFLARQLREIVGAILERSERQPIIILQSDHGPGLALDGNDVDRTHHNERFGIFAAYLFPGEGRTPLRATMSPVNNFRLVFNEYFGTTFDVLENRSYFSETSAPYSFIDVTDRVQPPAGWQTNMP